MVRRTWSCLNRNCRAEYESDADDPFCPNCGGKPSKWVPKACNYVSRAPGIDRMVVKLMKERNLTQIASPEQGLPATRVSATTGQTVQKQFASPLGTSATALPVDARGVPLVSCMPIAKAGLAQGKCEITRTAKDGPIASGLPRFAPPRSDVIASVKE